jgi:hypothetical protein
VKRQREGRKAEERWEVSREANIAHFVDMMRCKAGLLPSLQNMTDKDIRNDIGDEMASSGVGGCVVCAVYAAYVDRLLAHTCT